MKSRTLVLFGILLMVVVGALVWFQTHQHQLGTKIRRGKCIILVHIALQPSPAALAATHTLTCGLSYGLPLQGVCQPRFKKSSYRMASIVKKSTSYR